MIILRCTERLRRLLKVSEPVADRTSEARLGDWYANLLTTRPRHLAICINERSLLVVVVAIAPHATFLARFEAAAISRVRQIPAPALTLEAEVRAMGAVTIGRTLSRSVLGSLNELRYLGQAHLEGRPECDPETLGSFLYHTPMFAIATHWPWLEATTLLGGNVTRANQMLLAAT